MIDVLSALRFVKGAVSTKDLVPEMKHLVIDTGTVRAYNGVLALSSPIDFDVDCKPKASTFVSAIGNCREVTTLGITPSGRLRIASGSFKAYVECVEGPTPHLLPEGEEIAIDGERLLKAVRILTPFIGNDASRPWVNGLLLRGHSAYATNNVCLVEYWLGAHTPFEANIPIHAIKEMDRIGTAPTHVQISNNSISFHYPNGQWIRSQLYSTEWPDLSRVLDRPSTQVPVPAGLFEGLEAMRTFTDRDDLVYFGRGGINTSQQEGEGASYAVPDLHPEGIFKAGMLRLLDGVATTADFTQYPQPTMFQGDNLRGAIIGRTG